MLLFTTRSFGGTKSRMGSFMANKLNSGDTFPDLLVNVIGGRAFNLKDNLEAKYNIILFYRGHW